MSSKSKRKSPLKIAPAAGSNAQPADLISSIKMISNAANLIERGDYRGVDSRRVVMALDWLNGMYAVSEEKINEIAPGELDKLLGRTSEKDQEAQAEQPQ